VGYEGWSPDDPEDPLVLLEPLPVAVPLVAVLALELLVAAVRPVDVELIPPLLDVEAVAVADAVELTPELPTEAELLPDPEVALALVADAEAPLEVRDPRVDALDEPEAAADEIVLADDAELEPPEEDPHATQSGTSSDIRRRPATRIMFAPSGRRFAGPADTTEDGPSPRREPVTSFGRPQRGRRTTAHENPKLGHRAS
jgi:hypothetical protein